MSTSFVRERSDSLFSSSSIRAQVICYFRLKKTTFEFFTLAFTCFHVKIPVTTAIMLCMDNTLHEDVSTIFGEFEVQNLVHVRTFPQISRLRCMSWTTTHADYDQANKLLSYLPSSFTSSDLKLSHFP